jgi:hypothetical protein
MRLDTDTLSSVAVVFAWTCGPLIVLIGLSTVIEKRSFVDFFGVALYIVFAFCLVLIVFALTAWTKSMVVLLTGLLLGSYVCFCISTGRRIL